jgi:predicted permease
MRALNRWFARIRNFVTGHRGDERLREEMEQHVAMQTEENIRAGMSPDEAKRQARLKLGGVETIREQFHVEEGLPFLETLLQDLRFAFRVLRKSPQFALTVVITLALGIGVNTAVFSIVYGVIFRPLPYPQPQQIVQLTESSPRGADEEDVTYQELQFLKQRSSAFQFLAGYTVQGYNLGAAGSKTERVKGLPVSADYFSVLGIKPFLGRDFLPEENRGAGAHVAVLSYGIWKRQTGGDPEIVGGTITLDGEPFSVIGVMPPGLEATVDPILPGATDVWTPLALVAQTAAQGENVAVLGRIRQGISFAQARAQVGGMTAEFRKAFPNELGPTTRLSIERYQAMLSSDVRTILLVLFGAVGFVLLIACANVANLLLGRAAVRTREFAVRTALGASRKRLVRQLLTESILLSVLAAFLALLLALIGMQSLVSLSPSDLPRVSEIHLDGWAMAFTLALGVGTGVLFGLAPAFRASSGEAFDKMGEATARVSSGRWQARFRAALVVSEVGLSLVLLTGAALLIETFWHVLSADPGFNPTRVLSIEVYLSGSHYDSTSAVARYYDQAVQRIEALPGVQSAAVVGDGLPLQRGLNMGVAVRGKQDLPTFGLRSIQADYFPTLSVPLIVGRAFTLEDNEQAPHVAVISESAAHVLFPGRNPRGELLHTAGSDWQVVGVCGDVKSYLDQPAEPTIYVPLGQMPFSAMRAFASWFATDVVVRTSADPLALSHSIEQQLQAINPSIGIGHIRSMDQVRSSAVAMRQFNMTLLSIFGGLALLLAAIGIYGVIAYSVTQRIHEIGVRMALGAKRSDVLRLMLTQGMILAGLGIVFGIVGALALTRFLEGYLYGVKPTDPIAFAAPDLLLAAVAVLACSIPAWRAMKVNPLIALRHE